MLTRRNLYLINCSLTLSNSLAISRCFTWRQNQIISQIAMFLLRTPSLIQPCLKSRHLIRLLIVCFYKWKWEWIVETRKLSIDVDDMNCSLCLITNCSHHFETIKNNTAKQVSNSHDNYDKKRITRNTNDEKNTDHAVQTTNFDLECWNPCKHRQTYTKWRENEMQRR